MGRHLVFVDLPEDGRSVIDRFGLPAEQASRQACNVIRESKLCSGANAYRQTGIIRRRESTRSGAEIARDESVSHFSGPRPHALKAKVTHLAAPFFHSCATLPHNRTDNAHQARLVPRFGEQKTFQRTRARRARSARIFRCLALLAHDCCCAAAKPSRNLAGVTPG